MPPRQIAGAGVNLMQNLQQVLRDNLLPWAKAGASERIVVAAPHMNMAAMPSGVRLTNRKLPGKRVIVKSGRLYGNTRYVNAEWPEAGMHEVKCPRLLCVTQGQINYQVGNYLLGCRAGDFILIPPGLPHPATKQTVYHNTPPNPCHIWFMSQHRRGLQCWASFYETEDSAIENYLFLNEQVNQLFGLFVTELQNQKHTLLCDSLLFSLMTSLQREVLAERYLCPGPMVRKEPITQGGNEFIQNLENYIGQHLNEHLTLDSVAHHFYISRAQFVRRVRQESGRTFIELLTDYRMKEAKILLRESEWTAQTIANFVGFTSPTYFHKLFVEQVGCTPGKYRLKKVEQIK